METDNVLLQNDTTQKRKSPEVQILYNEAFKVWNRAANSWNKMLVINQLSIVFSYVATQVHTVVWFPVPLCGAGLVQTKDNPSSSFTFTLFTTKQFTIRGTQNKG